MSSREGPLERQLVLTVSLAVEAIGPVQKGLLYSEGVTFGPPDSSVVPNIAMSSLADHVFSVGFSATLPRFCKSSENDCCLPSIASGAPWADTEAFWVSVCRFLWPFLPCFIEGP